MWSGVSHIKQPQVPNLAHLTTIGVRLLSHYEENIDRNSSAANLICLPRDVHNFWNKERSRRRAGEDSDGKVSSYIQWKPTVFIREERFL